MGYKDILNYSMLRRPAKGVLLRSPALGQGPQKKGVDQHENQDDDVLQPEAVQAISLLPQSDSQQARHSPFRST